MRLPQSGSRAPSRPGSGWGEAPVPTQASRPGCRPFSCSAEQGLEAAWGGHQVWDGHTGKEAGTLVCGSVWKTN